MLLDTVFQLRFPGVVVSFVGYIALDEFRFKFGDRKSP